MNTDTLLAQAIAEAYASAPQDVIVLHSLEIHHKTFTTPIRAVRWPVTGEEPEKFRLRLESDAPRDKGKTVEFIGVPFDITLPEKNTESPGQFELRLDYVGDTLDEYLENAALGGAPITAIYREYVKDRESEGPAAVWPGITLTSPRLQGQTLVMDGSVLDWMQRPFGRLYLPSDYPGLVAGR